MLNKTKNRKPPNKLVKRAIEVLSTFEYSDDFVKRYPNEKDYKAALKTLNKLVEYMMPNYIITEGTAGMWHYHLSNPDDPFRALCGARVMNTSIPLKRWKVPFGENFAKKPSWCVLCDAELQKANK